MEMQAETGVCSLEISDATAEDSGEYAVEISNEVGSLQAATDMQRKAEYNKKLLYREEHGASVVLSWCTLWHLSGDKQQINS